MVEIVAYNAAHMRAFNPGLLTEEQARGAEGKYTWSAIHAGHVVGMAGISVRWAGFGEAWAFFGGVPMRAWPAITRKVAAVLDEAGRDGIRRIEMTVRCDQPKAYRWALRLGFKTFCARPLYGPDGADHIGLVRYWGDA